MPVNPCYERNREILDLDHYLELLGAKPGALEQAKPFRMAQLPAVYHQFRAETAGAGPSRAGSSSRSSSTAPGLFGFRGKTALERALAQRTASQASSNSLLAQPDLGAGAPTSTAGQLAGIRVQHPHWLSTTGS